MRIVAYIILLALPIIICCVIQFVAITLFVGVNNVTETNAYDLGYELGYKTGPILFTIVCSCYAVVIAAIAGYELYLYNKRQK